MRLFSSLLQQSFHSGGITLLVVALALAISASTALRFSNQQIQYAIEQQAGELLASDMLIESNEPLSDTWQHSATQHGLKTSQSTVFSSMAHTGEHFVMVNVKAIDDAFPLRGELDISPTSKQIKAGEIWLSPRVFDLLHVKVGDQVDIADGSFTVTGKITYDANQETGFSGFSPTVIIHQNDVARTNAVQVGSRIDYRLLMAGQPEQLQAFQAENKKLIEESLKLRVASEGNSRLMRPLRNLDTFMQLANLLTLLLCGIAIALTCQRYVAQNQDHIALLRCMGASRRQIIAAYLGLLGVVGGIATIIGTIFGVIFGYLLLNLMLSTMPNIHLEFSIFSILLGPLPNAILTCLVILLGFVLPSILHLAKVPPIRVLRNSQLDPVALWTLALSAVFSLAIFTLYLTENLTLSLMVMGALALLCVLLFLLMWAVLSTIRKSNARFEQWLRAPAQLSLQMTALALGLSLITVLFLLRGDLQNRWENQLPENTPNQFVYGLPPFDQKALVDLVDQQGWHRTPFYPNIRGRLITKNGQAFSPELIRENNSLRRELNLTQAEQFPADNELTAGTKNFSETHQVSVEQVTADNLGIKIGDELGFQLPDGELKAKVVSLRKVEWESFSPNFFFIFSPNTLDENAGSYLGSFYVPDAEKAQLVNVIQQFPTTVFIDIDGIIEQIKRIVNVITQVVSLLAFLVFSAGLLVLLACLNLMMDERRQEVALLRAIGMSQQSLKRYLTTELAFIGFGAGVLSIGFAELVSYIVAWRMEMPWSVHYVYWLILPILMAILCGVIGRYRLTRLWKISPLSSLRSLS